MTDPDPRCTECGSPQVDVAHAFCGGGHIPGHAPYRDCHPFTPPTPDPRSAGLTGTGRCSCGCLDRPAPSALVEAQTFLDALDALENQPPAGSIAAGPWYRERERLEGEVKTAKRRLRAALAAQPPAVEVVECPEGPGGHVWDPPACHWCRVTMDRVPPPPEPPPAAAGLVDYEAMRMQRGWPTPNNMRRTADALDALTPARYGDVLRWFADLCDAALADRGTETPPDDLVEPCPAVGWIDEMGTHALRCQRILGHDDAHWDRKLGRYWRLLAPGEP